MPVLKGDGMKTLLEPADIHPDDDRTRLVVSHTDSRAREGSRYIFFFNLWVFYRRAPLLTQSTGRHSIYRVSTKEGAG